MVPDEPEALKVCTEFATLGGNHGVLRLISFVYTEEQDTSR